MSRKGLDGFFSLVRFSDDQIHVTQVDVFQKTAFSFLKIFSPHPRRFIDQFIFNWLGFGWCSKYKEKKNQNEHKSDFGHGRLLKKKLADFWFQNITARKHRPNQRAASKRLITAFLWKHHGFKVPQLIFPQFLIVDFALLSVLPISYGSCKTSVHC